MVSPRESLERAIQLMTEHGSSTWSSSTRASSSPWGVVSTLDIAAVLAETGPMSSHTGTLTGTFDRVVCGVDRSEAGVAAARVAGLVAAPTGRLTLVSVEDPSIAVHAGWAMARVLEELAAEAREALERGREEDARRTRSKPGCWRAIRSAVRSPRSPPRMRPRSSSAATASPAERDRPRRRLHLPAPRRTLLSVLIARGEIERERWPRRIVAGVDGSADSAGRGPPPPGSLASASARRFAPSSRPPTRTSTSRRRAGSSRAGEEREDRALDVFNVLSETADLLVVGSRGLRGLRALGSLSERLAHEARCSVLVVRSGVSST